MKKFFKIINNQHNNNGQLVGQKNKLIEMWYHNCDQEYLEGVKVNGTKKKWKQAFSYPCVLKRRC